MTLSSSLQRIAIVLVEPTHPGNIGAVARAMKNMGLSNLVLVNPKAFPDPEATARASGATDILLEAKVVSTLPEALADYKLICGTSNRVRSLSWPTYPLREAAKTVMEVAVNEPVAIVFGRESSGLSNEELMQCHQHIFIPVNAEFPSLNVAMAVQLTAYELRLCTLENHEKTQGVDETLASQDALKRLYEHLEHSLIKLEFLDPKNPRLLMPRIKRFFSRALLTEQEVQILRGVLTAIDKH